MQGLKYLFGENPHEKQAAVAAQMMNPGRSGFASPLMAYVAGKEMSASGEWDQNRANAAQVYYDQQMQAGAEDRKYKRDKLASDQATQIFGKIIEISKHDAPAATQILNIEAGKNPMLESFKGVKFRSETKDDWATVEAGDGQAYQINLPLLAEFAKTGGTDKELHKRAVIPIGLPKPRDGKEKDYTATQKEWKANNEERAARGEKPLTWEEYKEYLSDLSDPTGISQQLRREANAADAGIDVKRKEGESAGDWLRRISQGLSKTKVK